MSQDYGSWSLEQLTEELKKRNFRYAGTEAQLAKRLRELDAISIQVVNDEEDFTFQCAPPDLYKDLNSSHLLPLGPHFDKEWVSSLSTKINQEKPRKLYMNVTY
ncbi:hypothetical protein TKK_0014567 [Trichogramma kaykai]